MRLYNNCYSFCRGQNRLGHLLEVTRARIAGEESSLEDAKVTREREEALCRERAALIRECEEHKAKVSESLSVCLRVCMCGRSSVLSLLVEGCGGPIGSG